MNKYFFFLCFFGIILFPVRGQDNRLQAPTELMGDCFLMFNTVIRANQIEVARGRNAGKDEREVHTPEAVIALRNATDTALFQKLADGDFGFTDILAVERRHLSTSHVYTYHVEGFAPGGGLCVYSPKTGALKKIVDAGEGMILDADLHWNAKEIVFSWKRKGKAVKVRIIDHDVSCSDNPDENYQIYTVNIDGTNLRQITNAPHNNLNCCWLPDGGIAFISDRKPAYAYCYVVTSPVLYRMERDGSKQKRLSANYLMDFTPSVL
ncbi:MAG: hypothetical protein LBT83_01065, partial [Tannerella sp.]|nr:hypothetical protein [Tannerella sp.]